MKIIKNIFYLMWREYKISIKNINDLLTILLFFFLSIFVFIFAIGSDKNTLNSIGVGILWSLLLLSSTLSLRKFYEEDFKIEILSIMHMGGMSYELIVFLKIDTIKDWQQ